MPVYQVKISLQDIEPTIWRRVHVSSDITLAKFHNVIQAAMGWENAHLYMFQTGTVKFTTPYNPYDLIEMTAIDARKVKLAHIVPVRKPFHGDFSFELAYEYDFGDSWQHLILFEDIVDTQTKTAICVDGARVCPPEDIGGIWGYQELMTHAPDFDAEAFDIEATNKRLKRVK